MTESSPGCYVYAVMRASEFHSLGDLAGVDPGHGPELLAHGDLAVAVSAVRLQEFGAEALTRNLENLCWVERIALTHNAVLARVRSGDAVVPFRACTIFDDQGRVREMLDRERAYLLASLERLQRRDEWGVKLLADRSRLEAAVRAGPGAIAAAPDSPGTPGRAFFVRKREERSIDEKVSALAKTAAERLHGNLRRYAAVSKLLPPQDPRVSGRPGEMILNGAYLVDRSAIARFKAAIKETADGEGQNGFAVAVGGPFAPYNFVLARGSDG